MEKNNFVRSNRIIAGDLNDDITAIIISDEHQFAPNDFTFALNRNKEISNVDNKDIMDAVLEFAE